MGKKTIITKEIPLPVDTVAPHLSFLQQRSPKFLYQGAWNMPDGSVLVQFKTNVSATSARIKCEPLMPTQIIDFGHGKRIVHEIEQDIDNFVNSFGQHQMQQ